MDKKIYKLALASVLTALSIVFDIIFRNMIPVTDWGFPYYAIPLVVGSIMLGPIYGGMMGFASDVIGFFLGGGTSGFNVLFSISAIAWGMIPYFMTFKKKNVTFLLIAVLVSHLVATLSNTFAMWAVGFEGAAFKMLPVRLSFLPLNVLIITGLSQIILRRLVYNEEKNHLW